MPWAVAAAAIVAGGTIYASNKASSAAKDAARTAADAQQRGIDYLERQDVIPRQFREGALEKLGGLYGLEGGEGNQQEFIDEAMESPLYQQLMGNQQFGEEAILRNQAATGGFRSGSTQVNLSEYNTRLKNEALLESYNNQLGGLQSLANLPSNANSIASLMVGKGSTLAAGQIGAAQAEQAKIQGISNAIGQGLTAYGQSGGSFSDIRAKKNIQFDGIVNGHKMYTWDWRSEMAEYGLKGEGYGIMAHEVIEYAPEAVGLIDGILCVDYDMIGLKEAA